MQIEDYYNKLKEMIDDGISKGRVFVIDTIKWRPF